MISPSLDGNKCMVFGRIVALPFHSTLAEAGLQRENPYRNILKKMHGFRKNACEPAWLLLRTGRLASPRACGGSMVSGRPRRAWGADRPPPLPPHTSPG